MSIIVDNTNASKKTSAELSSENLEQAVGGSDSSQSIRIEMDSVRASMKQTFPGSEEYKKLESQLENFKSSLEGLTSNNQLIMIGISSRMSASDNCKKMIGDSAKAHADNIKGSVKFR